jgi:hypothetical protein
MSPPYENPETVVEFGSSKSAGSGWLWASKPTAAVTTTDLATADNLGILVLRLHKCRILL